MADILIVDDSETLRSLVRQILEGAGYSVAEANDGKMGLSKMKEASFKLILCDINMPEMNGLEMCLAASRDQSIPKVPIVMLTTEANSEMKILGKQSGVIAWMTKPVVADRLVAAVNKLVGEKR